MTTARSAVARMQWSRPLQLVAAALPHPELVAEAAEDEAGEVDEVARHVLEHAQPAVAPGPRDAAARCRCRRTSAPGTTRPTAPSSRCRLSAITCGSNRKLYEVYQMASPPRACPLSASARLRVEDERLLHQHVLAAREEVLQERELHVVGHGEDGGVVAVRRAVLGAPVVGGGVEGSTVATQRSPRTASPLPADIAEARPPRTASRAPHPKCARFSRRVDLLLDLGGRHRAIALVLAGDGGRHRAEDRGEHDVARWRRAPATRRRAGRRPRPPDPRASSTKLSTVKNSRGMRPGVR